MGTTAFVLGGGGVLGAVEVGMLRALFRAGIRPDLVVGLSIGAINAALVAADPEPEVTDKLVRLWATPEISEVYGDSVPRQLRRLATRAHLHSPAPLQRVLERSMRVGVTFEDMRVPLHLCAANIERAEAHWFSTGRVVDAVLASAALPGVLPPVEIGGEHYLDGNLVAYPINHAVELGADEVFMLQVGRLERPLQPPQRPWEATNIAMEIARRVRFTRELAAIPEGVRVHVLPGGAGADESPWAYRDVAAVGRRVSEAYAASRDYLTAVGH
ncbi:patatin-like phospholipase family protein [Catellatospora methionotrophica]|uniref:patatin-like phospholipase family protein n=1 Tax=Catellatospora methionotrophica TaxID=121620 RepID=UPI0034010A44